MKNAAVLPIAESTHVAAARRAVGELARRLSLSDDTVARAELVAVELAGNILHHAEHGSLYLAPLPSGSGLHIIAVDLGPGVGNLERAMTDGFSTGTTPGLGLGAVKRLVSSMDVYSRHGSGTTITATLREEQTSAQPNSEASRAARLMDEQTAVISTCIAGEQVNGDSWAIYPSATRNIYLLVDGLGHGAYASQAAATAVSVANSNFAADPDVPLATVVQRMHTPMHATRGAAIMLISILGEQVQCCGVGNIGASLNLPDGTVRNLISHNGTVGHRMARVQEFPYVAPAGSLLIMHSDGISTRWKASAYPGLQTHAPATIAGLIYRDSSRSRDDATVLVARLGSPASNPAGTQVA